MNTDEVIFTSSLLFSICFGFYYRTIRNRNAKKNVGTVIGILLMLIAVKTFIFNLLMETFVNALIILYIDKRRCHLVSFTFTFLYLVFLRPTMSFGISNGSVSQNTAQMMLTLKLVGLAFEVNTTYTTRSKRDFEKSEEEKDKEEANSVEPTFLDIFHYAFNYIGVLTGPYYRYRTFIDHFNYPFAEYADWKREAFTRLKYVPFYAILFFWLSSNFPTSYFVNEEFFERSWLYRYWYIWPTNGCFRIKMYIGFLLANSVCITAGLGAYPSFTKPRPGQGPSQNFSDMKKLPFQIKLSDTDFDFKTVENINPYATEFCTTCRESMKYWNNCVQYWLAVNIYKRFPLKKYRTLATMLVSALWHGTYLGAYLCLGTMGFLLVLEDIYIKLYTSDGTRKFLKVYQWIHCFFKMHFFSYQFVALELMTAELTLQYYNSVYHMGAVVGVVLYVVGWYFLKVKESNKMTAKLEEEKSKIF